MEFQVDFNNPMDISIPLRKGLKNPNCYNSDVPDFSTIRSGGFIGSVALGGPCNHHKIVITPHGNGTHTECYGHISPDPDATINKCLKNFHFPACLITVRPRKTKDGNQLITCTDVIKRAGNKLSEALIIRTTPNTREKLTKQYSGTNPPYLEEGLARMLLDHKVSHLVVDLPSIDQENDGGRLLNHHEFWNYPQKPRIDCTITELAYIPDSIPDGNYLLNLQIFSIESDASPSKPVLYNLIMP